MRHLSGTNNQRDHWPFFIVLCGLYFSQGLPSGILAHALPTIMRDYGIDLRLIGALDLLALPWFFKFIWAPIIDQRWQRTHWIFGFQLFIIPLIVLLSLFSEAVIFGPYLALLLSTLFVINCLSASQDIATDGLASSTLQTQQLGFANTVQVAAYKLGLILGGSLLLISLDYFSWQSNLRLLAIALCVSLAPLYLQRKTIARQQAQLTSISTESKTTLNISHVLKGFILQPNMALWLAVLVSFKIADSLGSAMLKPMLVDLSYSKTAIGSMSASASIVGMLGAGLAGLLFMYVQRKRLLIFSGFMQALGIGLFALIPMISELTHGYLLIMTICLFEQFFDGLSTVIIFACMMGYCRKGLEGSDYTLQMSIHLMGAGLAGLSSGFIAQAIGYESLFIIALIIGIFSLLFIIRANNIQAIHGS